MSTKMTVCAASAAFFGMVLAASAAGDFYGDAEVTNSWINAGIITGMSSSGGPAVTIDNGNGWTRPTEGWAVATNKTVMFDTEATDPLSYQPLQTSGEIALVNVDLFVEPNSTMPSSNGLDNAQAALTVVTNTSLSQLQWVGLVRSGSTNAWVVLDGDNPGQGVEYKVQIALDNRDGQKKIRYSVKTVSAGSYTILTSGGKSWLENPLNNKSSVTAVAFAGAGTVSDFSGDTIVNDGATISGVENGCGFDFTNGTVKAVFSVASGDYTGKKAVLRLVNFADGEAVEYEQSIAAAGQLVWDLPSLMPGGVYSYTLSVKSGDAVRAVKTGTFEAANMDSDYWFCAKVVGGEEVLTNGKWTAEPEIDTDHWNVSSDALFTVSDLRKGSNAVSRVDTIYSFETPVDIESLDGLGDDVIGGLVAVSDDGGKWCAFTSANGGSWQPLVGGVVPQANTEYIVRAEFDFLSDTKRVRYSVARNDGSDFIPLALNGNEWIALAIQTTGALQSVGMSGKGSVKSVCANIADRAVVKDSADKKFLTIWDAVKNGTGPFTLLTNATLEPTGDLCKKEFTINEATFHMLPDKSELGKWRLFKRDGVWYLMKPGATYIFF